MFDHLLRHRSGRVIALARAVLAGVYLVAIWADPNEPVRAATEIYLLLVAYFAIAVGVAAVTWNNWWLDAKLAWPTHVLDVVTYTLLILTTEGYTSPFFVMFLFLILSAAIRWSWRETALTAAAVVLLYFGAGLGAGIASARDFELQRFIIRGATLPVLSAILIWFGVNQGFSGLKLPGRFFPHGSPDDPPVTAAAQGAMEVARASKAVLLWRGSGARDGMAIELSAGGPQHPPVARSWVEPRHERPFLFDLRHDRAVSRSAQRRMRFFAPRSVGAEAAADAGILEGLAIPFRTETGDGKLLLGGIDGLCVDHIDLGAYLSSAMTAFVERQALLRAVEESASARARLSLARDLHDGIVQFLAGATFRVEAIGRALRSGEEADRELGDLKQLLLLEQQELRSAIGALRKDEIALPDLAADLGSLCERLERQWDIRCSFSAEELPEVQVGMRLHLDTHHLVREAVANAVRHAHAKSVRVQLATGDCELRLNISNDGGGSDALKQGSPWSLRERVDEANGTLTLATRDTGASVSITLPIRAEARP